MSEVDNRFANMPARQKVSALIFLIIAGVIIWQVIGLFRGSSGSNDKIVASAPSKPALSSNAPNVGNAASPNIANGGIKPAANVPAVPHSPAAAPTQSPILSKPAPETVPPITTLSAQQAREQNKYVSAINELQMLKIQKEIAETNQAIVTAKLATVTAEKSITSTLTPPPAVPTTPPPSTASGSSTPPPGAPSSAEQPAIKNSYVVYSVSMEQDQWHAVIGYQGSYFNVTVGDILPSDGSKVTAIDQKGVTLQLGGMEHKIPLSLSDIPTKNTASTGSSEPGADSTKASTSDK
ncbi:MAG TPA: type IV pilus biogenesis protein PilP [Gammaproteobacteria bacterium]|nr:type IV pilus biogenesis protein PilP [Gammaproteobacteria bacterium]